MYNGKARISTINTSTGIYIYLFFLKESLISFTFTIILYTHAPSQSATKMLRCSVLYIVKGGVLKYK